MMLVFAGAIELAWWGWEIPLPGEAFWVSQLGVAFFVVGWLLQFVGDIGLPVRTVTPMPVQGPLQPTRKEYSEPAYVAYLRESMPKPEPLAPVIPLFPERVPEPARRAA